MESALIEAKKTLEGARRGVEEHLGAFGKRAQGFWNCACSNFGGRCRQWGTGGAARRVALASLSGSSRFQPLYSLAAGRDQLKAQLSSVPVYAVANKKEEYVLLSPQGDNTSKSRVGLMFMSEDGAWKLIEKLKKENPKLGKITKVITLGLDDVVDLLQYPNQLFGLQGVTFRLVPDTREVANALEVFRSAGVPARSITGVPVFQAEGLSVMDAKSQRATPLFLSKTDMDIALKTAGRNQNQKMEEMLKQRASMFEKKAEEAWGKVEENPDSAETKKWKRAAEKAQSQAQEANEQLSKVIGSCPVSRVEVGSLEDVIDKIGKDNRGAWSSVVLIRPGVIKGLRDAQALRDKA